MSFRLLVQLAAALSLTFASILALAAAARADQPDIEVIEPFARASIGQASVAVAYFTLHNHGPGPDRLIGATTAVAGRADLHTHLHDNGIARMRRLDWVEIPGGETVAFEPGGLHIMLTGLKGPLREGERFDLTLKFEASGAVTVEVPVRSFAAGSMQESETHDH